MPPLASRSHIRAERRRYRRAQDGRAWSVKDLPKFYYHRNFCEVVDGVTDDLNHLLGKASLKFSSKFRNLPFEAQCAYVRVCGRKGRVFNIDRFDYPEIRNLPEQFKILNSEGFVEPVSVQYHKDYFASLTKPELTNVLLDHACEAKFKKSWKKDKLVNIAVNEIDFDGLTLPENIWVQSRTEALEYILFLHSGQVEGNLQNLTLRDLGLIKLSKSDKKYGTQFESHDSAKSAWFYAVGLRDFRQENMAALDALIQSFEVWPAPLCPISAGNRDKLLHKIGGLLERRGDITAALRAYTQSDTALCNERAVRLRYKQGDKDWVKSRLEEMIESLYG